MAWYPVYRIPDAPLNGRFLTFHALSSELLHPSPADHAAVNVPARPGLHSGSSSSSLSAAAADAGPAAEGPQEVPTQQLRSFTVPITGLKWCNLHGERWLEPLNAVQAFQEHNQGASGAMSMPQTQGPSAEAQHCQLQELQLHAEHLARGHGLRLLHDQGRLHRVHQRHPDFEFFHSRAPQ